MAGFWAIPAGGPKGDFHWFLIGCFAFNTLILILYEHELRCMGPHMRISCDSGSVVGARRGASDEGPGRGPIWDTHGPADPSDHHAVLSNERIRSFTSIEPRVALFEGFEKWPALRFRPRWAAHQSAADIL